MVNSHEMLNLLFNTKIKEFSRHKWPYFDLRVVYPEIGTYGFDVGGTLKVVIISGWLSKKVDYRSINASVNTMLDEQATWNEVTMLFLRNLEILSQGGKTHSFALL